MISKLLQRPAFRFGLASIAALMLDLVLVLIFVHMLNISLPVSAGLAFVIVGFIFYFVHEYWTFLRERSKASSGRFLKSIASQTISLAARVGIIALIEPLVTTPIFLTEYVTQIAIWAVGVGASFSANFFLNKYWVFR